jgi:CubicO group peptidase (beta-lactamase class C family)
MAMTRSHAAPHASRSSRFRNSVRDQLQEGLTRGIFPGAVACVVMGRRVLALDAVGFAQIIPPRRPLKAHTIFDLASLTKPLATTTAILQLCARELLELDAPVATYLPSFANGGHALITIRHLLTHTSGLPAWEMLYLPSPLRADGRRAAACRSVAEAVERISATPTSAPPGAKVDYSDLGFIVLGHLVALLSTQALDVYTQHHIARQLGLRTLRFRPPASWRRRCAATEMGNAYERARAVEQGLVDDFRWRTHLLCGDVHDGNAYYLGGGVAGHAGLFGTAHDVARIGQMLLHGGVLAGRRILPAGIIADATTDQTAELAGNGRGLGWAVSQPWFGRRASAVAFGHTGFTGTSVLVDPARKAVIVLLTNRVHPSAESTAIVEFRPAFHDAVLEALDK